MTVKEFCKATGMNDQTAYRLIKKYRDGVLSGHITKVQGESYDLDDYAVRYLTPPMMLWIRSATQLDNMTKQYNKTKSVLDSVSAEKNALENKCSGLQNKNSKLRAS